MLPIKKYIIKKLDLRNVSQLGSVIGSRSLCEGTRNTNDLNCCNRYGIEQTLNGTYNGETLPSRFKFDLRVDGLVFHSRRRLGSEAYRGDTRIFLFSSFSLMSLPNHFKCTIEGDSSWFHLMVGT